MSSRFNANANTYHAQSWGSMGGYTMGGGKGFSGGSHGGRR